MTIESTLFWLTGFVCGMAAMAVLADYLDLRRQPKRDARRRFAKRGN